METFTGHGMPSIFISVLIVFLNTFMLTG